MPRSLSTKVTAIFQPRHWRAFGNIFRVTDSPLRFFADYFFRQKAGFPRTVGLETPIGKVRAHMSLPDDLLTVNEIFCRLDYEVPATVRTVVDFGSNIGISALYFLSRNKDVQVWVFEPNPANVVKLKSQVADYAGRVILAEVGVAPEDGVLGFAFEPTGRYGGVGLHYPDKMDIEVRSANRVLAEIQAERGNIDVLKIDIESLEEEIVRSLSVDVLSKISLILLEGEVTPGLLSRTHDVKRYGPISRFTHKI